MDWRYLFYTLFGNHLKLNDNGDADDTGRAQTDEDQNEKTSVEVHMSAQSDTSNDTKKKYVLVIGSTRTGKSSLCKTLASNSNNSGEINSTDDGFVTYDMEEQGIALVDVPGIGDNVTTDFQTLEKMVRYIKKIGYISQFILTIHGQNPRLTERHQEVLRLITSALGSRYLKSTVVVFTYWEWDEYGEETRKRSGETEEKKTEDINKYFREAFSINHDVPTLFLDNYVDRSDNKQLCKLERTKEQLLRYIEATPSYSPYD